MNNKIRVGVVGVGYLGRFHALIYSKMPQVKLVGVMDQNIDRAKAIAKEANCYVFTKNQDLIDAIDAVSIVVPTSAHFEVAHPFLEQGIHTLLEKPIAATYHEGKNLVALAAANETMLQIGHLERFNPGIIALAQRIKQPRFIEAQRMGGFLERVADVDVVVDLMIHDIDIILSLITKPLINITAVGTPVLTTQIDIANARLEFANGTVANVVASRVSEDKLRRIRVFQPQGYLSLDMVEQTLDSAVPEPNPKQQWPDIRRERIQLPTAKPLDAELAAFIDAIGHKQVPLVNGEAGLKALEIALQVREKILC